MTNQRSVCVVTDSTSDIPTHLREELGIEVVALTINFESETLLDGVDISAEQYVERLRNLSKLPSTAQPTVDQFQQAYKKGLDAGMDVVCVTISSGLSGTNNSANLAAEQLDPQKIRVIDSRNATMALGWVAIEAARAAQGGATLDEVVQAATVARDKVQFYAVLDSLDYVYKGGRIGRASHMVGSALGIKPILGIEDGTVSVVERVRTWKKALKRMIEVAASQGELLDVAVMHTDNLAGAQSALNELKTRFPGARFEIVFAGPTIATYAGPGAVGIMIRTE